MTEYFYLIIQAKSAICLIALPLSLFIELCIDLCISLSLGHTIVHSRKYYVDPKNVNGPYAKLGIIR